MIQALERQPAFQLSGTTGKILDLLGFHVRLFQPPWLSDGYGWLMTVAHVDEDFQSTAIVPLGNLESDLDHILGILFKQQEHKFPMIGFLFSCIGGCHEEGISEIDLIRHRKESAIINQDFERACQIREQERNYLR